MNSGTNRELAENKLILLYTIDRIDMPVSNSQITKIILENKFMNYFFLQQYLNEMCDSNLLEASTKEDKTFYSITRNGKQTLSYFSNLIPPGIIARINNNLADMKSKVRNEILVTADYTIDGENEFIVNCKVSEENFSLIDINITVGTKNDARSICDNWKKYSHVIYAEIIDSLIKKRE